MSGFSKEWLSLREVADHRARDPGLREVVVAHLAGREHVRIVDLASGSGSNLRGLSPFIAARQSWRLVDNDPFLLAVVQETLAQFRQHEAEIDVALQLLDLAAAPHAALEGEIDLVTASAFFDLVSEDWIERFCTELARRRLPLYAVLTYSGEEIWKPEHPTDAAAHAAFHAHQARDKGFGPAAGPRAAALLEEQLKSFGYRVSTAYSPWRLEDNDADLIAALADGAARAIEETGCVAAEIVEDWRRARRQAISCEIGHIDLFARMPA
ncbi:SAM-dependent methyltransferase [Methylocystis iwaonis]|uniref:SAM-dependent methyltransferase n=1 Tax=Methylocystis iwaonis TaxID=2885079 RepID=UPI002E7C144D|nr:SAM-dependent methyltransferase [Methylocystis iwaonis]